MSNFNHSKDKIAIALAPEAIVTEHLLELIGTISTIPTLLKAPIRSSKIMSTKQTSSIYLVGDWIAKTGLSSKEQIKVIPLHRLLIIIPDANF